MTRLTRILIVLLCCRLAAEVLYGQITVQGTVTDNGGEYLGSGAEPVPDVLVTFTDQADTTRIFSTVTDAQGLYSLEIIETGVHSDYPVRPEEIWLYQNYPNPFNPSTVIRYELSGPGQVSVRIYNILGHQVKTLFEDVSVNGSGRIFWDATDDQNLSVPAGLYICSLEAEGHRKNIKMLLVDGHQQPGHSSLDFRESPAAKENVVICKGMSHQYRLQVTGEGIADYERTDLEISEEDPVHITVTRTVTDQDGNVYQIVKIGDQWWTAGNLRVTHFRNGDPLPNVTDDLEWANLTTGACCAYDNDESNVDMVGYLYNWYAVVDGRQLAPAGWHVPTDAEWKTLEMALGMSQAARDNTGYRGTNEGSQLAGRADLWYDGDLENNAAFGQSGFSAFPAGYRKDDNDYFYSLGFIAEFWSSSYDETYHNSSSFYAWGRGLHRSYSEIYRETYDVRLGFSIRLVRD